MRARITEVVCGTRRNRIDMRADRYGDFWVFDDHVSLTNGRGETDQFKAVHDHHVIAKTLEAPATAGASAVGGA